MTNPFKSRESMIAVFCTALIIGMAFSKAIPAAAADVTKVADSTQQGKLIVHEWGTFTSFSGSNGVQLEFRPLINADLPGFVYDRALQAGVPSFSKGRVRSKVRMETPVTYFYTDQERTVRAKVEFPQGLLTEFYPPVESMAPAAVPEWVKQPPLANSKLDWGEIHLIPTELIAPNVKDPRFHTLVEERLLPDDRSNARHYYYARETDSALVHIRHGPANADVQTTDPRQDHFEKFLFYRGVGKFDQPLQVVVDDSGLIRVTNNCLQPIRSLFRVTVAGKTVTLSELAELNAGETIAFPTHEVSVTSKDLQQIVSKALVREKLYPREAEAMVKTWADSWFDEEGTRVFYMMPRERTDELLPLTIDPTPDESVRVLVGRVEIMLPSVEKKLLEVVRLHALQRLTLIKRAIAEKNNNPISPPIPLALVKLGRLAEPALVRIHEIARDPAVSNEASILLPEIKAALDQMKTEQQSLSAISE